MAKVLTRCPRIASHCEQLPTFERGQKQAYCSLCQKHVHNWSALSLSERARVLAEQAKPCVRYALWVPVGAALLLGHAQAQDSEEAAPALETVEITGGTVLRHEPVVELFMESELAADEWLDEQEAP